MVDQFWFLALDRLEDPFELFPMQSVSTALAGLVGEKEQRRLDRAGPWGAWSAGNTVEDDNDFAVVEHLIGAAFVLGQAAITQAVSLVRRIHEDAGEPLWIPSKKAEIIETAAPAHAETGLSKITIIDAMANYYKHHYEWSDDWSGPPTAKPTIDIAVKLGLRPSGDRNLNQALILLREAETREGCGY